MVLSFLKPYKAAGHLLPHVLGRNVLEARRSIHTFIVIVLISWGYVDIWKKWLCPFSFNQSEAELESTNLPAHKTIYYLNDAPLTAELPFCVLCTQNDLWSV